MENTNKRRMEVNRLIWGSFLMYMVVNRSTQLVIRSTVLVTRTLAISTTVVR